MTALGGTELWKAIVTCPVCSKDTEQVFNPIFAGGFIDFIEMTCPSCNCTKIYRDEDE
jgi:hypothetical protein